MGSETDGSRKHVATLVDHCTSSRSPRPFTEDTIHPQELNTSMHERTWHCHDGGNSSYVPERVGNPHKVRPIPNASLSSPLSSPPALSACPPV